jgi:hypothetical protein
MDTPVFHCKACDKMLKEDEVNARFSNSGSYVGLCSYCARWLPPNVGVIGLDHDSYVEEEDDIVHSDSSDDEEEIDDDFL